MSLRSRLQRFRARAERAVRVFMEEPPTPTENASAPEHDVETLRRIHGEYLVSVDKFVVQREQWKDMFSEWKSHLVAQRMLTRALEQGRREVRALAELHAKTTVPPLPPGLYPPGATPRVALPHFCIEGSNPADLADEYEFRMNQLGHSVEVVPNANEEKRRIVAWFAPHIDPTARVVPNATERDEGDALAQANRELFELIRKIEVDRNTWKDHYVTQQREHGDAQAVLQQTIARVSDLHGKLLAAVNERRVQDQKEPIKTRVDLDRLLQGDPIPSN